MSFGCPENLAIVRPVPKRNFSTNPLAASDPEGYTEYMPNLMKEIQTLGINSFFPPNFTLNFIPLLPPPPGATAIEIATHAAQVRANELADYEFPSVNLLLAQDLNSRLAISNAARQPDGTYPPGTVIFTRSDNATLISVNLSFTIEENARTREIELIGPFLLKMKDSITVQLSTAIDAASVSDRAIPRRKNSVLRKAIQYLEIVGRGSADTYNPILVKRFNDIGTATNAEEALMVLDQMDMVRTDFKSYVANHPGAVPYDPPDQVLIYAIIYRFQKDTDKLNSVRRKYQKKFDDPTTAYNYAADSMEMRIELSKRTLRPNVISSPNPPNPQSSNYASIAPYKPFETTHAYNHPPAVDFTDLNTQIQYNYQANLPTPYHQSSYQQGYYLPPPIDRLPTPTFQPSATTTYPYSRPSAAWPQSSVGSPQSQLPLGQAARCRTFPFCSFLNCKFAHCDDHGLPNPQLTAIQDESYRQQTLVPPGIRWEPDASLRARLEAILSSSTPLPPANGETPLKRQRYGPGPGV